MSNISFDYTDSYPMHAAACPIEDIYANTSFSGSMFQSVDLAASPVPMQMPFMAPPSPLSSSSHSPHSARSLSPCIPSPGETPASADRTIQPRSARIAAKSSASALKQEYEDALLPAPTDRKRKASKAKGGKPGKRARANADPSDDSDSEGFNLESLQAKNLSPEVINALLEENDLKKQRLARKAALARESRQKKKSRMEQLEDEVAHLRALLAHAQAQNGAVGAGAGVAYSLPTINVDVSPPMTGSSSPQPLASPTGLPVLSTVSSAASLAGSYSNSTSASLTPTPSTFSPASSSHIFSRGHLAPVAVAQGPMDHISAASAPAPAQSQSLASFVLSTPSAAAPTEAPVYATEASVQDLKDTLQNFMGMMMQMMQTNNAQRTQ
jgi:hypothetical protein